MVARKVAPHRDLVVWKQRSIEGGQCPNDNYSRTTFSYYESSLASLYQALLAILSHILTMIPAFSAILKHILTTINHHWPHMDHHEKIMFNQQLLWITSIPMCFSSQPHESICPSIAPVDPAAAHPAFTARGRWRALQDRSGVWWVHRLPGTMSGRGASR